jgi:hypothetical protein
MNKSVLIAASLLIFGCGATAYQPYGLAGGYSDKRLSNDEFIISFDGNIRTDPDRAIHFTMLRAAEITLNKGYKYFVIERRSSNFNPNEPYVDGTTYSPGSIQSIGDTAHTWILIKCYKRLPAGVQSYDADIVQKMLKK